MMKRIPCILLFLCIPFVGIFAQKNHGKSAKPTPEPLPTAEEIAAQHAEEMLENTRNIIFVDSLVVNKDAFLSALRLSDDAGRFTQPDALFHFGEGNPITGQCAFVNPLSSAVYYTQADTLGRYSLYGTFRNGGTWAMPAPLPNLDTYDYADYPFVAADGVTLYFAAESDEGIGGLDLYVTRLNTETRQYVRPENMGFPFNSPANDYLLATDENSGVGALVTDRRQPDDKVCIYWFALDGLLDNIPYAPPADAENPDSLRQAFADIASIAATQKGNEELVSNIRRQWSATMKSNSQASRKIHQRFIVNDNTVYTSLGQFHSTQARKAAEEWIKGEGQLRQMTEEMNALRANYAVTRSKKTQQRLQNLETALESLRDSQRKLAKKFRKAEQAATGNM